MPLAADDDRIGHDVLRQSDARCPGVPDMVEVGTRHLAVQRDLFDGLFIRPLLACTCRQNCERAILVDEVNQLCRLFYRKAWNLELCLEMESG